MKKIYQYSLILCLVMLMAGGLQAQLPKVDIGLFQKDPSTLQIRLKPDQNFDGVVSNVQFTLKWDATSSVDLGAPALGLPVFSIIPVVKSGDMVTENGVNYQKFSGTGNLPMNNLGAVWTKDGEVILMEISMKGSALGVVPNFEIGVDAKTTNRMFNGVFYVELNAEDRTGGIYSGSNLPVEYLSFTAKMANDHDVSLDWTTASEIGNDYFVIEKKRGAGSTFEAIGKVTGAGTSTEENSYTYLDNSGMANVNFYRLKQVDFDGKTSYSQVVEIAFDLYHNDKFVLFPTPAKSHAFLQATGKMEMDYTYSISDLNGKIVSQGTLPQDAPENKVRIDVSDMAAGTYYIRTNSLDGKSYLNRMIKVAK